MGVRRGEVSGHGTKLRGLLPAAERRDGFDFGRGPVIVALAFGFGQLLLAGGPDRFIERRFDHAGRKTIRAHVKGSEILGHHLHEIDHGRLGCAVGRIGRRPNLGGHRGKKQKRPLARLA